MVSWELDVVLKVIAIETVLINVFPCDNPGSGRPSYVNIFQDRSTQWSPL